MWSVLNHLGLHTNIYIVFYKYIYLYVYVYIYIYLHIYYYVNVLGKPCRNMGPSSNAAWNRWHYSILPVLVKQECTSHVWSVYTTHFQTGNIRIIRIGISWVISHWWILLVDPNVTKHGWISQIYVDWWSSPRGQDMVEGLAVMFGC